MVHWVLQQRDETIACDVLARNGRFVLAIRSGRDDERPLVERFDRLKDALRRHAEVSWLLEQSGWVLAERRGGGAAA